MDKPFEAIFLIGTFLVSPKLAGFAAKGSDFYKKEAAPW